jgi:predicted nuclease of predicted toxin-antitoxin system
MAPTHPILFFTDNDVPRAVGDALLGTGHSVVILREVMLDDSPDQIVAEACVRESRVLVTHNVKDFRKIVYQKSGVTRREAMHLCRVELKCRHTSSPRRIVDEMKFIELEWSRYLADDKRTPMRITIDDSSIRLARDWNVVRD